MKFTAEKDAEVKLTASAEIFSTGKEFTLTATGEEQYVAINPTKENETTNFSYSINDVKCKEKTQVTFKPKAIYAIEFEVPVAKVGEQGYFDINDAIANAGGSTVELLTDIDGTVAINKACTINTNGFAFKYTVTEDFKATEADNTITVVAYVAQVGSTKYVTWADAYAAGTEITLLADIDGTVAINKACTINTNGFAFNYTVANTLAHLVNGTTHSFNALTTTATKWGIYGAHQDWKMATAQKMYQVAGHENLYAVLNVTLKADGFKFLDTTTTKEVTPYEANYDFFFKPNSNWNQAGARFVGYFWNASGNKWYELKDNNGDGIYECKFDNNFKPTNVIFLRKDPNGFVYNNWTNWNRIGNITIASGKNCYTMASGVWNQQIESGNGYTGGSWSTINNTPYWTGTDFGAWMKSTGKQYYDFSTEVSAGAWYTCYSNNLGEQFANIGVGDFTKTYDIYLSITKEDWGDKLNYTIVEHGTAVTPLQ